MAKSQLIRMVNVLQALYERPHSVSELVQLIKDRELGEVTERTFQRDMVALNGHFGVYPEENTNPTIWCMDKTDFQKLLELDDRVALALVVAKKQLQHTTPAHFLNELDSLMKRAQAQLESRDSTAAQWMKRVKVAPASHHLQPPQLSKQMYQRLMEACLEQKPLKVTYHKAQGDEGNEIEITALGVFYRGMVPYMICRDHKDDDVKQLPFSRISGVVECITVAARVQNFDIDKHTRTGALAFRYEDPFELELEIFKSVRREVEDAPLGEQQIIEPIDGLIDTHRLKAKVPYTLNLIQWLMARSPYLKVIGPANFREKFYEELRRGYANNESEHVSVSAERNFKPEN